MGRVPGWAWLALAVLAAVLWLRRGRPVTGGPEPIRPGYNGSPDKTAQNPKVVPFRG